MLSDTYKKDALNKLSGLTKEELKGLLISIGSEATGMTKKESASYEKVLGKISKPTGRNFMDTMN